MSLLELIGYGFLTAVVAPAVGCGLGWLACRVNAE